MSRLGICVAGLLLLVPGQLVTAADVPLAAAQRKEAGELVRRLGSDSYQVREDAGKRLFKLGIAARPFLEEGARDTDPEIRRRCQELLPAVQDADVQSRIDAFLADKEGKKEHDLPGWKRFRKLAGDEAASRALFAELMKADSGRFIADCEARPETAGDQLLGRAQLIQQRLYDPQLGQQPASVPEVAALLFVGTNDRVRVPVPAIQAINGLFYQPTIRSVLGSWKSPLRRLLVAWMNQQSDANVIPQVLYLAMSLEMKELLPIALKVAEEKKAKGYSLGLALTAIGKLGDKENTKLLESFLEDDTMVGNFNMNQVQGTTQVRDVALSMLVHITGQNHKDFGFAFVDSNVAMKFNPFYLGFKTPAQRTAAMKKWRENRK